MEFVTLATSQQERDRAADVAVLPVGSFEQHGGHLPLSTDTLVACILVKTISDRYSLFLLPPLAISCSHEHAGFPGTVSITASTLTHIITDVMESFDQQGILGCSS
jgi:creatinine amidohydrolase